MVCQVDERQPRWPPCPAESEQALFVMVFEVVPQRRHNIQPQLQHPRVFVFRGAEPRGALLGMDVLGEQVDAFALADAGD
jgi:hypothetical protein